MTVLAEQLSALDEIFLDVATQIELSARDRRVAESRYRRLKDHLQRPSSPLAALMGDDVSMIYAQGSMATSTTIVSGLDDDRFDVDAIVELEVPAGWDHVRTMDALEQSLQGFPGVTEIVRCSRCIQLRFPFMHMDVTILDRRECLPVERAGVIPHVPDNGQPSSVPSNPWGFSAWFRRTVKQSDQGDIRTLLNERRAQNQKDRLLVSDEAEQLVVAEAEQVDLPPVIPSELDSQQAVALKLLKRYLNIKYTDRSVKRPPSIYLAKRAADEGYCTYGLAGQLMLLAANTAAILRQHLTDESRPEEINPSYPPDKINDRWPRQQAAGDKDMQELISCLDGLVSRLEQLTTSSLDDVIRIVEELFGESVATRQAQILVERYKHSANDGALWVSSATGRVGSPAADREGYRGERIPAHHFHACRLGDGQQGG